MEYEITLLKVERVTAKFLANSPSDAIKLSESLHPGFKAQGYDEIIGGHEAEIIYGAGDELFGSCENCEKSIFCNDDFVSCDDGPYLCRECANALSEEVSK